MAKAEIRESEVRGRKLMRALKDARGCWRDEDHPELKNGAYAWVRSLREQSDKRLQALLTRWHSDA